MMEAFGQDGLVQVDVARKVGARAEQVNRWARGEEVPSERYLPLLPGALGVSGHWLLTGDGPREQQRVAPREEVEARLQIIQRLADLDVPLDATLAPTGDAAKHRVGDLVLGPPGEGRGETPQPSPERKAGGG